MEAAQVTGPNGAHVKEVNMLISINHMSKLLECSKHVHSSGKF